MPIYIYIFIYIYTYIIHVLIIYPPGISILSQEIPIQFSPTTQTALSNSSLSRCSSSASSCSCARSASACNDAEQTWFRCTRNGKILDAIILQTVILVMFQISLAWCKSTNLSNWIIAQTCNFQMGFPFKTPCLLECLNQDQGPWGLPLSWVPQDPFVYYHVPH